MSFMMCIGPCCICGGVFGFNPDRVPSLRVRGEREPVCRDCMVAANAIREIAGLQPLVILDGAYDEAEVM
jgi:hypothetical protein